jgi:hypothetical protein
MRGVDPLPDDQSTAAAPARTTVVVRKSFPQWVLEGVFIVVSVALGFAVAQYGEYRSDREFASRVLHGLRLEVETNIAVLEPLVPLHQQWAQALNKADTSRPDQSSLDIFFATRPAMPADAKTGWFPILRRSVWDTAVAAGALRLIDYDLAASLSEIYGYQEVAEGNVERLSKGVITSVATYDPASRVASTRLIWLTIEDLRSTESVLLDLYRKHLPAIRAADDRGE